MQSDVADIASWYASFESVVPGVCAAARAPAPFVLHGSAAWRLFVSARGSSADARLAIEHCTAANWAKVLESCSSFPMHLNFTLYTVRVVFHLQVNRGLPRDQHCHEH